MNRFNVRVYGILINENNELLVTDEKIRGNYFTKFPGGGLEFGEGTRDCLEREFMEEMGLKVEVGEHLYTTDFFQESAFRPGDQIISIYYYVQALDAIKCRISTKAYDFHKAQLAAYAKNNEFESFRFIQLNKLSEDDLSLPIDKVVVRTLIETQNSKGKNRQ